MSRLLSKLALSGAVLSLAGCMSGNVPDAPNSMLTASEAGSLFGEVCIDLWPDVEAAQLAVRRDEGLQFDDASGLFTHPTRELQMRINQERCAIRYLTDTPETDILVAFSEASSLPENGGRTRRADGANIRIGTEDAGNGLIRASGVRGE